MNHIILMILMVLFAVCPLFLCFSLAGLGLEMGNESLGGLIMLPLLMVFTVPISVIVIVADLIWLLFRWFST